MSEIDEKDVTPGRKAATGKVKPISRRALLRGGVTAMPVILTLQSGAALARSSNLIGAAPSGSRDKLGRTLCLDTNSVYPAGDSRHIYDMGEPPRAEINIITDRRYKVHRKRRAPEVSEGQMCREGGTYWYKDRNGMGWQSVELPKNGVVVSAGAMTSISDHVIDTLI